MEQFSLEEWLQNKSRKVVTRLKKSVQIISIEGKEDIPIVALVEGVAHQYKPNGYHADIVVAYSNQCRDMGDYDLFFADEEEKPQSIEIPFGAKDSEFVKDEYIIPEGCEARIEGNKVIIEKIQKEDELTEFEKAVQNILNEPHYQDVQAVKQWSKTLLDLARKELEKNIEHSAVDFAKSYMGDVNPSFKKVQESEELWKWKMSCLRGINKAYKQGKEDAFKDLPKWRKSDRNWITNICDLATIVKCDGGDYEDFDSVVVSNRVDKDDYYIELGELLKLPKEE